MSGGERWRCGVCWRRRPSVVLIWRPPALSVVEPPQHSAYHRP